MIIMGFGDGYSSMRLGKVKSAVDIKETMGLNENSAVAIENSINQGLPVVFCHDSTTPNMNFSNTLEYEIKGFFNDITNGITNWWKESWEKIKDTVDEWFGDGTYDPKDVHNEYNATVHSRRVSEGYYSNYILRDALGLDAFGITNVQRERGNHNYSDAALMQAHSYNNLYNDVIRNRGQQYIFASANEQVDPKNSSKEEEIESDIHSTCKDKNGATGKFDSYGEWKRYYISLSAEDKSRFENANKGSTAYNALMLDTSGYKVSWEPTRDLATANTKTTAHTNGYTTYNVKRYKDGDGASYTTKVTQVNSGQITTYPYDINTYEDSGKKELALLDASKTQSVKDTHEQYFQVNLDENIYGEMATVWYCLASDSMSGKKAFTSAFRNDCENAYFIYTKGNATYTGAGHQNSFTAFEAKLFMNTLIASSKTAPKTPKVRFYDESGVNVVEYVKLIQSVDNGTEYASADYDNPDNATSYHTKSNDSKKYITVELDEELHFKVNNTASVKGKTENRKVSFYYLDGGKQVALEGLKVYKGGSIEKGTPASLDSITPGVVYTIEIPKELLANLVGIKDNQPTILDPSVELFVHIELKNEEKHYYELAGKVGSKFTAEAGVKYYVYNNDLNSYVEATSEQKKTDGTLLYIQKDVMEESDVQYFYGQQGTTITYLDDNKSEDAEGRLIYYYRVQNSADISQFKDVYYVMDKLVIEDPEDASQNKTISKMREVTYSGDKPSAGLLSTSGDYGISISLLPLLELR